MRICIFFFLLILFNSCHFTSNNESSNDLFASDTIAIIQKRYYSEIEIPDLYSYNLIRDEISDSIISFKYYLDSSLVNEYNFNIKNGTFSLIEDGVKYPKLFTDTFNIYLENEELVLYKYEYLPPKIDADMGYLFNKKYGLIGYVSYSWGSKTILTNWNEIEFEKELKEILFDKNTKYLRRNYIPPPPNPIEREKLKKILDEEEINEEPEIELIIE